MTQYVQPVNSFLAPRVRRRITICKAAVEAIKNEGDKNKFGQRGKRDLPSDPRSLKLRINNMRTEWSKRKLKCMDLVEGVADAMEKRTKDAIKLMDVETDEEVGAVMPAKHVVD